MFVPFVCVYFKVCVKLFPFLWLLFMPFYGSVWGTTCVIRQFFTFLSVIIMSTLLPSTLKEWIPCTENMVLLLFLCIPYSLISDSLVIVFGMLLWLIEPAIVALEAWQFVQGVHSLGYFQMDIIEENDILGKGLVITLWVLFDSATIYLASSMFSDSSALLFWFLIVIVLMSAFQHIVTYLHSEGIISSAAIVAFVSIFLCYVSWCGEHRFTIELQNRSDPIYSESGKSFLHLLLDLPQATTAYAHEPLRIFAQFFNWPFWLSVAVRLSTVLAFLHRWMKEDEELWYSSDTDESFSDLVLAKLRKPEVLHQLAAVFLYTQMVVYQLTSQRYWWTQAWFRILPLVESLLAGLLYMFTITSDVG